MKTNPTPAVITARNALIDRIRAAKTAPVHESCIYAFGPYADWIVAISDSNGAAGINLKSAAERLAHSLLFLGRKKELKELALFIVQLAVDDTSTPAAECDDELGAPI